MGSWWVTEVVLVDVAAEMEACELVRAPLADRVAPGLSVRLLVERLTEDWAEPELLLKVRPLWSTVSVPVVGAASLLPTLVLAVEATVAATEAIWTLVTAKSALAPTWPDTVPVPAKPARP